MACCRGLGLCARVVWLSVWSCFGWVRVRGGCGRVGCELYSGREYCLFVVLCGVFCRVRVVCVCAWCVVCVDLSVRWMPWHQGPMKDVVACDKPRGAG